MMPTFRTLKRDFTTRTIICPWCCRWVVSQNDSKQSRKTELYGSPKPSNSNGHIKFCWQNMWMLWRVWLCPLFSVSRVYFDGFLPHRLLFVIPLFGNTVAEKIHWSTVYALCCFTVNETVIFCFVTSLSSIVVVGWGECLGDKISLPCLHSY